MTANLIDLDDFERQFYRHVVDLRGIGEKPLTAEQQAEQRIMREAQAARDSGVCDEGETADLIRAEDRA